MYDFFLRHVGLKGIILLRTWTCLYIQSWEHIWKELIIWAVEDAFGVLMEEIRYKEKMGLWVRARVCYLNIEFLHMSAKDPFPTHLASPTLFIMSVLLERGSNDKCTVYPSTDASSLSFYLCLSFLSKKC